MLEALLKVNRILRKILVIIGTVLLIFKITETKEREINTSEEGFQIKEFDDIW